MYTEKQMQEKAAELLLKSGLVYATSDGNFFPGTKQGENDAKAHSFKFEPFLEVYTFGKEVKESEKEEVKENKQPKKNK